MDGGELAASLQVGQHCLSSHDLWGTISHEGKVGIWILTHPLINIKDCVSRPPFQLRTPLIVWNLLLSIFSIFGAARTIPEFIFTFSTHGIYHSLCVPR